MSKGFILLPSYVDTINKYLPEERRWPFLEGLFKYSMTGEVPKLSNEIEHIAFDLISPVIAASASRYNAAVENGKKGGAPKGNKNAVKKKQPNKQKVLKNQSVEETKQPENNQDYDLDLDKDYDYDCNSLSKDKEASAGARLEAAPPPRGYEWAGGVFEHGGTHYRMGINKATGESEVIQLD